MTILIDVAAILLPVGRGLCQAQAFSRRPQRVDTGCHGAISRRRASRVGGIHGGSGATSARPKVSRGHALCSSKAAGRRAGWRALPRLSILPRSSSPSARRPSARVLPARPPSRAQLPSPVPRMPPVADPPMPSCVAVPSRSAKMSPLERAPRHPESCCKRWKRTELSIRKSVSREVGARWRGEARASGGGNRKAAQSQPASSKTERTASRAPLPRRLKPPRAACMVPVEPVELIQATEAL